MSKKLPPLIITAAVLGNVPTKKMNPNIPITPKEIAEDCIKCYKAGAAVVHIHVRDVKTEKPSQDLNLYREVVTILKKEAPELILQLTTGGRCGKNIDLRINVVKLLPEMASFTTGSNNIAKVIYENSPNMILRLAKTFHDSQVKPEIECFDTGHIDNALFLSKKKKLLKFPLHFNFVLGARGSASGTVNTLQHMVNKIPKDCTWSTCGVGWCQFRIVSAAIAMGGHCRVGLEDMIYMPDGSMATNAKMVEKAVRIAKELGRDIATPKQAREMMGMNPKFRDRICDYLKKDGEIFKCDYSKLVGIDTKKHKNLLHVKNEDWNSWKWQIKNSVKTVEELAKFVNLTEEEKKEISAAIKELGTSISIPPRLLVDSFHK